MKRSILIICAILITISITAFGYLEWSDTVADQDEISDNENIIDIRTATDLLYNVDSRFIHTITKESLNKAKSIIDILPEKATESIESYQAVKVSIIHGDKETSETGDGDLLNTAQLKLLQATDYSTNIHIRANYKSKKAGTSELENDYLVYYMTIIPEKEAEYISGRDALIAYLKENSKEKTAIIKQDQLEPGKVSFTITKKGTVSNIKLTSTSGYPSVDKTLVELITNMPENWHPATNSKGENVDQELIFFFGLEGC